MANRVLTVEEQIDIELALRLYMDSILDSEIQYHKETVKRIMQLLKKIEQHRLAIIGSVLI